MAIASAYGRCSMCNQYGTVLIDCPEGLPPKVEQTQPPVLQQDAALVTDEPPRSAAGNPDAVKAELLRLLKNRLHIVEGYYTKDGDSDSCKIIYGIIEEYKSFIRSVERDGAA